MKRTQYLFIFIIICSIPGCDKSGINPKIEYNDKANQLIQQMLKEYQKYENCSCIVECPEESFIEIIEKEMPRSQTKKRIMKMLALDETALDSVDNLSKSFKLDKEAMMKMNIKLIDRNTSLSARKDEIFSNCPGAIICIYKPIFSKDYKTAVLPTGLAFTCGGSIFTHYSFKKGRWVQG